MISVVKMSQYPDSFLYITTYIIDSGKKRTNNWMFFKGLQFWDSFSYEYDMGFFQTQNYNIHPNAPWMEYIPTFGLNSRNMWPTTLKELTLNTGELTKSLVQPAMVFSWKNSVNFPWAPRLLLKEKYVLSRSKEIWLVVSTPLKNISQIGNLPQIGVNIRLHLKPPPKKCYLEISPP